MNPRNADERCASVVPVLPDTGRLHPADRAAPAEVPPPRSSADSALASEFARPSGTTCSHFGGLKVTWVVSGSPFEPITVLP